MELYDQTKEKMESTDWCRFNEKEALQSIDQIEEVDIRIMASLGALGKMLKTRADRELEKEGLTGTQVEVLLYLVHNSEKGHEITAKELETRFRVSNPTMSGILKRLEKKELIERTPGSIDKRNKQIKLKTDIRELHRSVDVRMKQERNKMFKDFSESELDQMSALLMKLLHNLDELNSIEE